MIFSQNKADPSISNTMKFFSKIYSLYIIYNIIVLKVSKTSYTLTNGIKIDFFYLATS